MGKANKTNVSDILVIIGVLMLLLGIPTLIISFIVTACVGNVSTTLAIILVGSGISVIVGGGVTYACCSDDSSRTALSKVTTNQSRSPEVYDSNSKTFSEEMVDDLIDSIEIKAAAEKHKRFGTGMMVFGLLMIVGGPAYTIITGSASKIGYAILVAGIGVMIIGTIVMDFAKRELKKL